ncbi:MAG: glycosyltransferase family 4 protein [Elusimicrobiota bacterium]|nr:glycosyltransferase family 4 protein [Endomicrobiia bacterium]MDW8166022.1 glycosyltransferase family 4 protein [Elusimicrobiota bacterium]
MKVCWPLLGLSKSSELGGGVYSYGIICALADNDIKIYLPIYLGRDGINCEIKKNWYIYKIPLRKQFKLGGVITNLMFLIWVVFIWFKEHFDILVCQYPEYAGYMSFIMKKLFGVKVVGIYHHIERENKIVYFLNKLIAKSFSQIITVSEHSKREIISNYRINPDRISVVYNGVDEKYFEEKEKNIKLIEKYKLEDKKLLLFVGSLIPRKNLFFLIDVFEKVLKKIPDVVLVVCGKGYQKENYEFLLKKYVEQKNLNQNVIFTGKISEEEKLDFYNLCDIFVFPSLLEGFGLVVAEAMACGKPVVVSNVSSLPELVIDGVTGFLANPKDIDDFVGKIIMLLKNKELKRDIGEKAKKYAIENFKWSKSAERTIEILNLVLENKRSKIVGTILEQGGGIETLEKTGQVSRLFNSYFSRYLNFFDKIYFFSYEDENYSMPENVNLFPAKIKTKGLIYSFLMPFLYKEEFKRCKVLRIFQMTACIPAIISKILWGIPFVATYGYIYKNHIESERGKLMATIMDFITKIGLKFADKVIVTSKFVLEYLKGKISEEKLCFIPNGVDLSIFRPIFVWKNRKEKVVYSIGRLSRQKNYHLLIEAIAKLKNVSLTIIGNGPLRSELEDFANKKNIKIRFIEKVENEKLSEILKDADVFVLSSLFEGHPKALTEAMACGIPCVGVNVEGIRDIIINGENGLLSEPNEKDLAEKIKLLLENKELAEKLGNNARKYVEENYNLEKLIDKEIKIILSVVKN